MLASNSVIYAATFKTCLLISASMLLLATRLECKLADSSRLESWFNRQQNRHRNPRDVYPNNYVGENTTNAPSSL